MYKVGKQTREPRQAAQNTARSAPFAGDAGIENEAEQGGLYVRCCLCCPVPNAAWRGSSVCRMSRKELLALPELEEQKQ